jgi:hypothetical protein
MGGIILALTIGFLLGILLMVILTAGREQENLLDRIEASRRLHASESDQPAESAGRKADSP